MLSFAESDNGPMADRWPHTAADVLPSVRVTASCGGREVGYAVVTPERDRFTILHVDREHRGRGYGEEIFQYVVGRFRITNFSICPHDGLEQYGRLVAWHERHGFTPKQAIEMVKR